MPQKIKKQGSSESSSEAASRLKACKKEVIKRWEEQARKEVSSARDLDDVTLRNALPHLLDGMVQVISTTKDSVGGERSAGEITEVAKEHGKQRAAIDGYTLDQVITEYRLLRQGLLEALEVESPLTFKERSKLLESIDLGISEAASAFAMNKKQGGGKAYRQAKADVVEFKSKLDKARGEAEQVREEHGESLSLIQQLHLERDLREKFVATLTHDLRTPIRQPGSSRTWIGSTE